MLVFVLGIPIFITKFYIETRQAKKVASATERARRESIVERWTFENSRHGKDIRHVRYIAKCVCVSRKIKNSKGAAIEERMCLEMVWDKDRERASAFATGRLGTYLGNDGPYKIVEFIGTWPKPK